MIDLHHQGAQSERDGQLVSGSILYPTTENVEADVLEGSKQLGAVVFNAVDSTGWGHLGKYVPGSIWQVVVAAEMAREYGVPARRGATATVASLVVHFTFLLFCGPCPFPAAGWSAGRAPSTPVRSSVPRAPTSTAGPTGRAS